MLFINLFVFAYNETKYFNNFNLKTTDELPG